MGTEMGSQSMGMEQDLSKGGFSWRRLLVWTTAGVLAMVILMTVVHGFDPFALIVGIPFLLGLFLLTRPGKIGAIVLLVLTIALGGVMWWQVFALMMGATSPFDFIPSLLFITSFVFGLIAAIAAVSRKKGKPEESKGAKTAGLIYALVLVLGLAYTGYSRATFDSEVAQPGDVTIVAEDIEFNTDSLEADAGSVTVNLTNRDNIIHTFTIEKLDVDLVVPGGTSASVTFDAEEGTYEFVCEPHADDMKGDLEVS